MRALHLIKTVDGANWAVDQVTQLVRLGIEVHVVLPKLDGRFMDDWLRSGAIIHELVIDIPIKRPWQFIATLKAIRALVATINPDIIHSHFFTTTIAVRYALGKSHPTPRVFQVPGPFHLEHIFFRLWELSTAGENDSWIASSEYTYKLYQSHGIKNERLFLSYYGNSHLDLPTKNSGIREKYDINKNQFIVGNINYMYPPRIYLGHTKGIKRHEDVIDALKKIIRSRSDVTGLIIGGQWGLGRSYEDKLKNRIHGINESKIIMTGRVPAIQAKCAWVDFDIAVHVPTSENCGGVIEPLMAGVPVIAARTGGIPEVIIDGVTGVLVNAKDPEMLADAINRVLSDISSYREMAKDGQKLVKHMFDVKRTSLEINNIYKYLLIKNQDKPSSFKPREYISSL